MALTSTDERDLLLALFDGFTEQPLWDNFLRGLMARTRAAQACLLVRTRTAAHSLPHLCRVAREATLPIPDFTRLSDLGLIPLATLRTGRVYALQEMVAVQDEPLRDDQARTLADLHIAHARFIRLRSRGGHDAWIVLTHTAIEFAAADSALLASLAPHVSIAVDRLAERDALALRAAMAEDALDILGIHQLAIDNVGAIVASSGPQQRQRLSPRSANLLAHEAAGIGDTGALERRTIVVDDAERRTILLRPYAADITRLPSAVVMIAAERSNQSAQRPGAAAIIAETLGLSLREAALAEAISRGVPLIEAGRQLRLTDETTRNYSKRIYAKTGAKGQADLVRLLLSSVAVLAS